MISLHELKKSLDEWEEALTAGSSKLARDASIQRFRTTYALLWKNIQKKLLQEDYTCSSEETCFRELNKIIATISSEKINHCLKMMKVNQLLSQNPWQNYNHEANQNLHANLASFWETINQIYQKMSRKKQKSILVTGGAGFIGSHLCRQLLDEGHEVLCVDNLFTGNKNNILDLLENPRFEFMRHDVTFSLYVEVDEIYNLACPASPVHYQYDPVQTTKTSVHGAINMLGLAKRIKVPILQASTSEIYGDPKVHPQPETYWGNVNVEGPRACYDEGKRCAETLFFDYYRQNKVQIRVVRIFNTYGPNMYTFDGRVVSNFIVNALMNKDIIIHGNGSQTRSFQYVDDLIEGMIAMMENKDNFIGPVNLGNPHEFSIKELANKVLDLIPESKSRIVYRKSRPDDPQQRCPDIKLAKEKLNWKPTITLKDGLQKTIEYFRKIV